MLKLPDELLKTMLDKYGDEEQILQTMGECGELIAVMQNYLRAQKFGVRTESWKDVVEEAVDVFFMIQQVRYANPKMFDAMCKQKFKSVKIKLEVEDYIEKTTETTL